MDNVRNIELNLQGKHNVRQWLQNRAQAKFAVNAFNSKQKKEKLAFVVCFHQTKQNVVNSRSCLAEERKEMYENYSARAQLLGC